MAKKKAPGPLRPAGRRIAPASSDRPTSGRREVWYWAAAIGLSAVVVYLNAIGNEFVLDDTRIIADNLRIRSLSNIPALFLSPYWDVAGAQALYRPLVLASYALNYAVHGLSTPGYAIVNIALHAAVSLLLFALVRGLGAPTFAAGVTGIAFALHPVHTEAVTGMAGRPELLAAALFLATILLQRRAAVSEAGAALRWRAGAWVLFAGALLAKESAITLLLVLPVMDALFPLEPRDGPLERLRRRLFKDYLPLLLVAVGYLGIRHAVLGGIVIGQDVIAPLDNPLVRITTMPLGERLGATFGQGLTTAFAVVVEYARLLVWPARLSPDYSYNQLPLVTSLLDVRFIAGVALVTACLGGVAILWRRSPVAAFGLAFLALTFSVVSNIVVTIGTICAERLLYLPSAGALIAVGMGVERLVGTRDTRRNLTLALLVILAAMGATRTWTRNRDWRNDATLWSAAIGVAPGSARVQSEYGRVLMQRADDEGQAGRQADAERLYAEAQAHFETALAIFPSYSPPMDGLATILSMHQRYDQALVLYQKALKVWPGSFVSLTNWAGLLWDRSRRQAAASASLRAEGKVAEADDVAGQADRGFRQAIEKVDQAIAIKPSYAHAHLIRALLMDGYRNDRAAAIAEFEEVLRLSPDNSQRSAIEAELARLKTQPAPGAPAS